MTIVSEISNAILMFVATHILFILHLLERQSVEYREKCPVREL